MAFTRLRSQTDAFSTEGHTFDVYIERADAGPNDTPTVLIGYDDPGAAIDYRNVPLRMPLTHAASFIETLLSVAAEARRTGVLPPLTSER